jgi:phage shock protein C
MKKLYRSTDNKVFSGLLAGLAEYFDVDPTLTRLLFVMITIFTGVFPGLIAYIFGIAIVPTAPVSAPVTPVSDDTSDI